MNLIQTVQLVALAAIWGASFMFLRYSSSDFGAVSLIFIRVAIGFLTLLPFLIYYKAGEQLKNHWKGIMIVGLTNTALPFTLFAYATLSQSAGLTSILNATAPIFTALVAFLWLKDKFTPLKVAGLLVGFTGVILLFAGKGSVQFDASSVAILCCLVATLNYGFAACYAKKYLQGVNSLAIAAGSLLFASIMLLPFLPFYWPSETPSLNAWLSAIVLGVLCTALAYIFYFRLLAELGPEKAMTVTYLIPVFGVLWGMSFLDERLSVLMLTGGLLILLGVGLTTGVHRRIISWLKK